MKWFKKFLIFLFILILLTILGAFVFIKTLKPEWVKNYLNDQISEVTGLKSEIQGGIQWQIFPMPGVQVDNIQVGSNQSEHHIHLDQLKLYLKFKPLLKKDVVFNEIKINGAQITWNLDKKPLGHTNKKPAIKKAPKKVDTPTVQNQKSFAIHQFDLNQVSIILKDKFKTVNLSKLNISSEQFNLDGKPFSLKASTNLTMTQPSLNLKASIKYQGQISIPFQALQNNASEKAIKATGQLDVNSIKINELFIDSISSNVKFNDNQVLMKPLTFVAYNGKGVGQLSYQTKTGLVSLDESITKIDTGKLLEALLKKKLMKGSLDLTLKASTNLNSKDLLISTKAKGNASIKEGELLFVDLDAFINELSDKFDKALEADNKSKLISLFSDINLDTYQGGGKTSFKILSMSFDKEKSATLNEHILVQTQNIDMQTQGTMNLSKQTINNIGRLNFNTTSKKMTEFLSLFDNGIPLVITGSLNKPRVYPDVQEISLVLSKYYLKKTFNKPINKLKDEFNQLFSR